MDPPAEGRRSSDRRFIRPGLYERPPSDALWTDSHIASMMLRAHLDGTSDLASRRTERIDAAVAWMTTAFQLGFGRRVLDLGCGPGLYAIRLARTGAEVTGIDLSERSIAHARRAALEAGLEVTYRVANYLDHEPGDRYHLVLLIYDDLCALAPGQRTRLLSNVHRWLAPGGAFLFDVHSMVALRARPEAVGHEAFEGGGFWAHGPHEVLTETYRYEDEAVILDRYTVVEGERTRVFWNWLRHYSPETLTAELAGAGLRVDALLGDVAGSPYDPAAPEFAVVAGRAGT